MCAICFGFPGFGWGNEKENLTTLLTAITRTPKLETLEELYSMADQASSLVSTHPDVYKQFEAVLRAKLTERASLEDKMMAAQIMSRMGSNEALKFLLEELKKPLNIDVPETNRTRYSRSAEALGSAIKENPKMLTQALRKDLLGILSSKDAKFTAAQNDLNKSLPRELLQEFDQEITQSRVHPSNMDPCKVLCRVATSLSKKLNDSLSIKPDAFLNTPEAKNSFSLAVRSLMGEFLLKASQSGCEIPDIQSKVSKLMNEAIEYAKGDAKETASTKAAVRESLKTFRGSKDALKRALDFNERVSNIDENGLPTNSSTLYFYLQSQRAAEALRNSGFEFDPKALEELQKKIEEHLGRVTDARSELMHGEGGSLLTTYALAAIGASLPEGSELQKKIASIFGELKEEYQKAGGGAFPYNFHPGLLKQTERGGSARSVVAQLAIFKGGKVEDKLVHADELLSSLSSYDKHFRDIFSGIGLFRTHDSFDEDHLAPYYGPSTIPYVFEAISLLGKEKELSSEQKQKLNTLKQSLEKKLLGMFEPNGLFQAQNPSYYSGAPLYDNALTGLALEQSCRDKKAAISPSSGGSDRLLPHKNDQAVHVPK